MLFAAKMRGTRSKKERKSKKRKKRNSLVRTLQKDEQIGGISNDEARRQCSLIVKRCKGLPAFSVLPALQ